MDRDKVGQVIRQLMTPDAALLCSLVMLVSGAVAQPTAGAPPTGTSANSPPQTSVTRYTDRPLTESQTLVMNQATKLSLACRMFRSLCGRWPNDLAEIQFKTEGVDYAVFAGKAVVTPLPDDSESIQIFDGFNDRAVKAVLIDFHFSDAQREAAQARHVP